ncbi:hypothetical protein AYL99_05629 [Fonsecaea erecta]|uniref:Uncharacterized protein n=1 Tax=Fonsecaea erecta TaxID=1367422 RepID=A0A178ZLH1_9EURO|nr:hypothetical protein AYL99_05629 [Fonsecaea erecta]OAP60627.1 hypothetical protein AYL99_05629 [Fonsecaea erecta]
MHHHNEHRDEKAPAVNTLPAHDQPVPARINRKPVPVDYANNSEPWPYSPVSPIDPAAEAAGLTAFPTRSSGESARSFSVDPARANAVFDQEYAPHGEVPGHDHHGIGAATAGLVASAALGHRDNHDHHRSRSRSSSSKQRSRQPIAIPSEGFDTGRRTSREYRNGHAYRDVDHQDSYDAGVAGEQDLYGVSATPPPRSRRNSAVGSGLPGAAAFNYANRPAVPSPLSSEVRRDPSHSPPRSRSRSLSRDAARFSFSYDPVADDYGAYPPFPISSSTSKAGRDEAFPGQNAGNLTHPDRVYINDKSYPPLDIPGGKSTNEYDLAATSGPLGHQPQTASLLPVSEDADATMESDDSPWRMSDGMPAGWQRASTGSPRNSREYMSNRDSGVGMGVGRGRRLRASDIVGSSTARPGMDYDAYGYGYGQAL